MYKTLKDYELIGLAPATEVKSPERNLVSSVLPIDPQGQANKDDTFSQRGTKQKDQTEKKIKPHAFALGRGEDGASVYFGQLLSSVTVIRFERIRLHDGVEINSLTGQDEIPGVTQTDPKNLNLDDGRLLATDLGWWGDVYLYWEVDPEDGEITLCDVRGPDEPEGSPIGELDSELERGSGGESSYFVRLGTVPETGQITQDVSSDVTWAITLIPENPDSSDDSSPDTSSDPPSSDTSSDPSDPGGSGGSGSSKDSAIVPASWSHLGYAKLFTSESPEVVFHDYFRDLKVRGRMSRYLIDPRFIEVCETGTLRATGYTSDMPFPLGVTISATRGGAHFLSLHALPDEAQRPNLVQVQITGIRKGFLNLRFPDADKAEFDWNERRLAYKPRKKKS